MKTSYPQELIDLAKENGYKAANLDFLDQILLEFNESQSGGIAIDVPRHISIANQKIISHLNEHAPLWAEKWQDFVQIQGDLVENLQPLAIEKLCEIQSLIYEAFDDEKHQFIVEGIDKHKKQMVRSTGDEDRVDVANPGGNESVPSDFDSISSSIGKVVSSYFSEKSMLQRLKSGEKITEKPPLMPCLIQELIGEISNTELPPVSGIIYTDSKNIRIQAAYGHGELVVNSKGNFDNFFVTNEDVVHQYIGDKKIRIVPKLNKQDNKLELEEVENTEFAHNPSLSEEQSMRLAKFSKFVQSKYGMRMDIEFVYDQNSNIINIVQARPIPEGKRKGLNPSALSDDFISKEKPNHIDGEIITPDVMTTKTITNKDELIVCKSIDQALTSFLKNKDNKVKAVIIDKTAPDTSHEAGFFTSQAIPVIYADDYVQAGNWVQGLEENILVIDPQHGSIYQIPKNKYQDSLIEEGVFRSTLAEHVTAIKREFAEGPSNEIPNIQAKTIGELVIEARNNPDATQKLFRYIQDETEIKECKLYGEQEIKDDLKNLLTFPSSLEEFTEQKEILAHLLEFITSIKNEKEITSSTYEQLIITGVELYKGMKEVEKNPQDAEIKLNYLNIHQKFNGLISSKGKAGILSTSLFNEIAAHEQKEQLKADAVNAGFDLKLVEEDKFLKLIRHKSHFINNEDRIKWVSFCYKECQSLETAEKLESLVSDIIKLDLKDYWLNVNFLGAYEKDDNSALSNLEQEYEQNLSASADILKASKIIDRMEHQIGQWSEPKNFNKLFEKELQSNIQKISSLISFDEENKLSSSLAIKQLYRLVDVVDLSMKQLQNSPLYEDKAIQVQNFKLMLDEFFKLMESQVEEQHPDRIQAMKDFMQIKKDSNIADELLPSRDFSVIKANFFQVNSYGFNRGFFEIENKNLADLYTLVHQALLSSIGIKAEKLNNNIIDRLPIFVKDINEKLLGERSKVFKNYNTVNLENLEKLSLLYASEEYPYINLHYNMPLRSHSGNLILKYNINQQSIELDYTMFGVPGEEGVSRWKDIELYTVLLFEVFADAKILEHKSSKEVLNFKIEINKNTKNIEEIFEILNTASHATNDYAKGLNKVFNDLNSDIAQGIEKFGLTKFMIDVYRNAEGDTNYNFLDEVIVSLKNSLNQETKNYLEKKALMHLMATDGEGNINAIKLQNIETEITSDKDYKNQDIVDLVNKQIPELSVYGYSVLAVALASKKDLENAIKIAKLNILDQENINYSIEKNLKDLIIFLIENNKIEEGFLIVNKVTKQDLLVYIAENFIEKNNIENAFKVIDKITGDFYLADIAENFIEKNNIENAFKVIDKLTGDFYLSDIAENFIEKNSIENAFKVINKLTNSYGLASVAIKFIEKNDIENAFKVINKITEGYDLASVAIKFIEKNDLENAFKVIDKITEGYNLVSVTNKFIENNDVENAFKVIDKITEGYDLIRVTNKFIENNDVENAFKVINKITGDYYLADIAENFVEKNDIENAFKIINKITDVSNLSRVAIKFIEKNDIENAFKFIDKLTNSYGLANVAIKFIEKNDLENAFKLIDKITEGYDLVRVTNKFIEKNDIENAFKFIDKLTNSYGLVSVAIKFIEKNDIENAFKLIDKITEGCDLVRVTNKFIEKDDLENSFKLIDKITDNNCLADIANEFIENNELGNALKVIDKILNQDVLNNFINNLIIKDRLVEAAKIAEKITSETDLNVIALKLAEKNFIKESKKVADLISIPTSLRDAYYKVSNMLSSYTQILPSAAAIDENSYRRINNSDYIVSELEKQKHIEDKDKKHKSPNISKSWDVQTFTPISNYTDFIEQYTEQQKIPKYNTEKLNDFSQNKLPETDLTAAAVLAARGAKFFVNKLIAGKKNSDSSKKNER